MEEWKNEKKREYLKKWRAENSEKVKEYYKKYYEKKKKNRLPDCEIIRFEESVGKKGQAGLSRFPCIYKLKLRVACNGLADRERIKNHKKPLIAEIQYLNETTSGMLRQPTLKAIKDE